MPASGCSTTSSLTTAKWTEPDETTASPRESYRSGGTSRTTEYSRTLNPASQAPKAATWPYSQRGRSSRYAADAESGRRAQRARPFRVDGRHEGPPQAQREREPEGPDQGRAEGGLPPDEDRQHDGGQQSRHLDRSPDRPEETVEGARDRRVQLRVVLHLGRQLERVGEAEPEPQGGQQERDESPGPKHDVRPADGPRGGTRRRPSAPGARRPGRSHAGRSSGSPIAGPPRWPPSGTGRLP